MMRGLLYHTAFENRLRALRVRHRPATGYGYPKLEFECVRWVI